MYRLRRDAMEAQKAAERGVVTGGRARMHVCRSAATTACGTETRRGDTSRGRPGRRLCTGEVRPGTEQTLPRHKLTVRVAAVLLELDVALALLAAERVGLVDLGVGRQLAVLRRCGVSRWRSVVTTAALTCFRFLASSAVYFWITSALSSWKSRSDRRMMSPWLIQT